MLRLFSPANFSSELSVSTGREKQKLKSHLAECQACCFNNGGGLFCHGQNNHLHTLQNVHVKQRMKQLKVTRGDYTSFKNNEHFAVISPAYKEHAILSIGICFVDPSGSESLCVLRLNWTLHPSDLIWCMVSCSLEINIQLSIVGEMCLHKSVWSRFLCW